MKRFTVRVFVDGSPLIVEGGVDPLGTYIETVPHLGDGEDALPATRLTIDSRILKRLAPGDEAEYEFPPPLPVDLFRR